MAAFAPASGWRSVRLDRVRRLVTLAQGAELDLGATAKAFAADRIAALTAVRPAQAILVGGYFGTWMPPELDTPFSAEGLARRGARLGARALAVLPEGACGVVETARVPPTWRTRAPGNVARAHLAGRCSAPQTLPVLPAAAAEGGRR